MKVQRHIFILITVVFLSCNNNEKKINSLKEKEIAIDTNFKDYLKWSNYIYDTSIVPLDDAYTIGSVNKVVFLEDGSFFCLDKKTSTILQYDSKGELLFTLNRLGKGVEEYTYLWDFNIVNDTIIALVNMQLNELKYYNGKGVYLKKVIIEHPFRFFHLYDNRILADQLNSFSALEDDIRLFFIDHTGKFLKTIQPENPVLAGLNTAYKSSFTEINDTLFNIVPGDNHIYTIINDSCVIYKTLNFEKYQVTIEEIEEAQSKEKNPVKILNGKELAMFCNMSVSKEKIVVTYKIKDKWFISYLDKASNSSVSFEFPVSPFSTFYNRYDGYFYMLFIPTLLPDDLKENLNLDTSLFDSDGTFLLKYRV